MAVNAAASATAERLALVRPLLMPDIGIGCADPLGPVPAPLPAEAVCLSPRAVPKRRLEFAAGRAAARDAMAALGLPPTAVPQAGDRAPVWPAGVVGSITHTRDCAMAVAALSESVMGLGLDVETVTPLDDRLIRTICTERERQWLQQQDAPGLLAKLIFSAKEAAYKCQYPLSRRLFGFDGMELELDLAAARFNAVFTADQSPFQRGFTLPGRWATGTGIVVTLATLEPGRLD